MRTQACLHKRKYLNAAAQLAAAAPPAVGLMSRAQKRACARTRAIVVSQMREIKHRVAPVCIFVLRTRPCPLAVSVHLVPHAITI